MHHDSSRQLHYEDTLFHAPAAFRIQQRETKKSWLALQGPNTIVPVNAEAPQRGKHVWVYLYAEQGLGIQRRYLVVGWTTPNTLQTVLIPPQSLKFRLSPKCQYLTIECFAFRGFG